MAQMVKNLPAMQETQVQPLGREDLLEKGMATHSSNLAWKIPWAEEPGMLQSKELGRVAKSGTRLSDFTFRRVWQQILANTLQYSCLENPPDRDAWQSTVHRGAEWDTTKATPCQ